MKLKSLSREKRVAGRWVPGHPKVNVNEIANLLVKKTATTSFMELEPFCEIVKSTYKSEIKEREVKLQPTGENLHGQGHLGNFIATT